MRNSLNRNVDISYFILIIFFVITPCFFCVQIANADLGHPQLTISSTVTPNEINRGASGTLKVVVKEIGGNDWAKDVYVTPVLSQGCIVNPPSGYISKINYGGSSTFTFSITVPETASIGSKTGTIDLKYYETGTLNVGVFGPYALSDSFSYSVEKGTGTVSISSSPSNATIKIDGISRGVTPHTEYSVLEGQHTISFSKSGYRDYSTTFTVSPGQTTSVTGDLPLIPVVQPSASQSTNVRTSSQSNGPVSVPTSSGSSDTSGLIILLIIGVIVVAGGYFGYSKIIKSKDQNLSTPPTSTSQKEKVMEPIFNTSQNRSEQTILNQINEIRNNPNVSSTTKNELNAIVKTIPRINPGEINHPLKTYARKQLNSINNNLDRINEKGAVFLRSPDTIKQLISAEKYVEAVIESDKFLNNISQFEEIYNKATAYKNALPVPDLIYPYNEGNYAVVIKVYEEKQVKIDQVNKLRDTLKQLYTDAEKIGSVPDSIKNNLQAQDIGTLERTINDLDSFIANAKPELTLSLDRTQLSAERWHKLGITITNTGLSDVENVSFTFSSEFETKGIKPFSVKAGQSSRTDISIISKNVGNILLEITLQYKDLKDREYSTVQEFWIDVVEKGTTTSPPFETPVSPVSQFTPRSLTPKQLPPDLSDRYTESFLIGQGGFARVFKAKRKDGKYVAIKIPIALDSATGKSLSLINI